VRRPLNAFSERIDITSTDTFAANAVHASIIVKTSPNSANARVSYSCSQLGHLSARANLDLSFVLD
jgi:hypothetical protein